jgi:hypothetical protein
MERQEIDNELSVTGARELLTSTSMARLAYLGTDGTPRLIPIGYFWTGEQVVISTAATAPKVAALSARPDVAPTIDAGDTPERARADGGIAITPHWVRYYDFGASRLPRFLQELAEGSQSGRSGQHFSI